MQRLPIIIPCVLLVLNVACTEPAPRIDHVGVVGTFQKINAEAGVVTFRVQNRSGQSVEQRAVVPADTDIMIDGRLAWLRDIRIGEPARVIWRSEESDGPTRYTALKIIINREEKSSDSS